MGYLFILGAILYGGSLLIFIDVPSILVVVGGTTSALLYAHPMPAMKAFVSFVKNAFQDRLVSPEDVTAQIQALAQKVRKEDLLSLENEVINDPFMARAVRLAVDGVPVDTIRQTLGDELTDEEAPRNGRRYAELWRCDCASDGHDWYIDRLGSDAPEPR